MQSRFILQLRVAAAVWLLLAAAPAGAATNIVIIAGKGGTPEFSAAFASHVRQLHHTLTTQYGIEATGITVLAESETVLPFAVQPCTTPNVTAALRKLAGTVQVDDQVLLVLLGHGTADNLWAKFNLEGPDLRDLDFAQLMDALPARRQIVINTTAASAGFIEKLSRPERIIITATRSAEENYVTVFPQCFIAALQQKEEVDLDKDGRVSLLEVFDATRDRVVTFYEQANRLRPEHPLLDDNGDGQGSETPVAVRAPVLSQEETATTADGSLAAHTFLDAGGPAVAAPAAQADPLAQRKVRLLAEIEALKAQKATLPESDYERKLEALFIALARLRRETSKSTP